MDALLRELASGAPRLRGTTLDAVIHIAESDLNELMASLSPTALTLEIQPDNRIVARHGVLHGTVLLPRSSDLSRGPELTFLLASSAVAFALKHTLKQPFLHVRGKHVIVNLAGIPALRQYRELLRYLTRVEIVTARRGLAVRLQVSVA